MLRGRTKKMQALLFAGCTISNRLPFLEKSARLVFKDLGIEFIDAPFTCCPDPVGVQAISEKTWLTLGARNLCLAEQEKKKIISLCNGCSETLIGVKSCLDHDKESLNEVKKVLSKKGYDYKGTSETFHFIRSLIEDVGIGKIKEKVKRPLKGLKCATHTGCHYMRPSDWIKWDDPLEPKYLDVLVNAVGAEALDYEEKMLCCGAGVDRTNNEVGLEVAHRKYKGATEADANCLVVNCPACFQQFENTQRDVSKKYEEKYKIPVFYITELIALAFGYNPEDLGLRYHRNRPKKLLKSIGIEDPQ
ncbi:MAG: hypothetical protein GF364_13745 [Candidatus Lokiarchaeota archaeon]|nr:hypothetical protein [Candidatus Lokiarchaeota archaeon]